MPKFTFLRFEIFTTVTRRGYMKFLISQYWVKMRK